MTTFYFIFPGVQASELEPLVGNNVDNIDGVVHETEERDDDLNELKITFRLGHKLLRQQLNLFFFFLFLCNRGGFFIYFLFFFMIHEGKGEELRQRPD